jgi:hypothetical protein
MRGYNLKHPTDLRSGQIFTTEGGTGSYMIISNDVSLYQENWQDEVRFMVIWFVNNKGDRQAPGLSFHGKGPYETPRTLFDMFNWIDADVCVGMIDREIMEEMIEVAELEGERT